MLTTFYPPYHFGGDAMYVYWLSNELARRGHQVTVVHCEDAYRILKRQPPGGHFPNHPNVEVHGLRSRLGPISPLTTYLTGTPGPKGPFLSSLFRDRDFDVVHFHNVSLVGGPRLLRYGDGVKLYTLHEHWLVCPMHILWKNNRELCERPTCLRCTLAFRRPPQLWRYSGMLARAVAEVDLFLAPSRFTLRKHRERGLEGAIRQLPYFVPSVRREPPVRHERPYFLYVGRLHRLKGVHELIEFFRGYEAADLVIAGDGDERDALERQSAGLGHVRLLGWVDPDRLAALYAGARALVVPSIGYDVFPLVVLEAFAQGTPVIAHDLGGLPEMIEDSGGGYIYRGPDALREALEALRQDDDRRRELGERGYEAYRRLWSEDAHIAAYFDAIEEGRLLARR
jgi:glycosyltransferase involved in cell wall biosynthesis